jgi:hypothetical protein
VAGVVEVHPPHGGQFGGSNNAGFTFTADGNYAVIIFHFAKVNAVVDHQPHGVTVIITPEVPEHDIVYTGVTSGHVISVDSNGGDVFFFNCAS